VLILLNKPFGVLCQFTDPDGRPTLADHVRVPNVYPAGRLDADSEGLLLLTDDGALQARLADPRHHVEKVYWVQVERVPTEDALAQLRAGLRLKDGPTRPARARLIDEPPSLWPRDPPIRRRAAIPTAWVEIALTEGRNRQVRRMVEALDAKVVSLARTSIAEISLGDLGSGTTRELTPGEVAALLRACAAS